VGLPAKAHKLLPDYIGTVDRLEDVPRKAVALIDESYLKFHSRSSMESEGRNIGSLINLSRQRDQTLVFVVQEARQLDVNIISQIDVLAIKELSDLSRDFERSELRRFTDKARAAFQAIHGDRRRWTWLYSESAKFEGLIRNELPSFWTPRLSRAFAEGPTEDTAPPLRGRRLSRDQQKLEAREMHKGGFSCQQIADMLGVSKATAWRLVNEDSTLRESHQ